MTGFVKTRSTFRVSYLGPDESMASGLLARGRVLKNKTYNKRVFIQRDREKSNVRENI